MWIEQDHVQRLKAIENKEARVVLARLLGLDAHVAWAICKAIEDDRQIGLENR